MYFEIGFLLCLSARQILTEKCTTPTGDAGECISLSSCPLLLRAFANPVKGTENFLREFKCRNGVCCVSPNSRLHQNQLFNKRYCGYQQIDGPDNKPNDVSIDKFPWLAAIRATNPVSMDEIVCRGSLINARYVLTAAHCVAKINERHGFDLLGVRLGDFSADNKTDRAEFSRFRRHGLGFSEDFDIEEIISHPFYDEQNMLNDIALLRLNKTVLYSDFIRPICLPSPDAPVKPGDTLFTAGWSRSTAEDKKEKIGEMITTTLMTNKQCKQKFQATNVNTPITMYHMCTSDSSSNTGVASHGDNGGPVMLFYDHRWHVEGILSYGTRRFRESSMKVQTKVSYYMSWIEDNMRSW